MPFLYIKHYTRPLIRAHPDWLFVFGDNLAREGYGGQAKEARGEPNAIGIPTKRKPEWGPDAFFADADADEWVDVTKAIWGDLWDNARQKRTIIWPLAGIGTDRAKLAERAPTIADMVEQWRKVIEHKANEA